MSWLDRSYRQGFKNLSYQAGLAEFDSVALARHWKALGADLVYMDALTPQGSLYQSKLLSRPPTLGDRDLCAPFIAECRKLGMRDSVKDWHFRPVASNAIEVWPLSL